MIRAGRIKDPIHGYVRFTSIERPFLDDPLAQRLRWIGQSGLAHLVFPEVRTSRFAHSLGAMHLSSRFLAAALRNTDDATQGALEAAMVSAVTTATQGFLPDNRDEVTRLFTADGLLGGSAASLDARPYVLIAEQGLRLAALFHDLGHLPFSHDFEYALGRLFDEQPDVAQERFGSLYGGPDEEPGPAIHERIGYLMATGLFRKLDATVFDGTPFSRLVRACVLVAQKILLISVPDDVDLAVTPGNTFNDDTVWWLLHGLMAGELDVDRCDYLLRDARAYGFEFASYDLDRLADNLVVVRPRPDRGFLGIGVLPQGVAAAESFLIARYRSYQWGPFHHKVAQLGAALQHCIRARLREALDNPGYEPELNRFLDALQTIASGDPATVYPNAIAELEAFVEYDDVWWLTVMRDQLRQNPDDPWLGLVCRRKEGPRSLWKRPDQFPGGSAGLAAFNQLLPGRKDLEGKTAWHEVVDGLGDNVLVSRHVFSPWADAPSTSQLLVLSADQTLRPLTDLSHITFSLREAWSRDVQVHAFSTGSADGGVIIDGLSAALTAAEPTTAATTEPPTSP